MTFCSIGFLEPGAKTGIGLSGVKDKACQVDAEEKTQVAFPLSKKSVPILAAKHKRAHAKSGSGSHMPNLIHHYR